MLSTTPKVWFRGSLSETPESGERGKMIQTQRKFYRDLDFARRFLATAPEMNTGTVLLLKTAATSPQRLGIFFGKMSHFYT
jgi:hypothetical protein